MNHSVILLGSCDPTTWRADISIPRLTEAGVEFYNPQVANYSELDADYKSQGIVGGIAEVEARAKDEAQELLIVIDGQTRACVSILEAGVLIARGRNVSLVVEDIPDGTEIAGQIVTGRELKDMNRARSYLKDLVREEQEKGNENVTIFPTVELATQHVINKLTN